MARPLTPREATEMIMALRRREGMDSRGTAASRGRGRPASRPAVQPDAQEETVPDEVRRTLGK
jgi:hypothetical protein